MHVAPTSIIFRTVGICQPGCLVASPKLVQSSHRVANVATHYLVPFGCRLPSGGDSSTLATPSASSDLFSFAIVRRGCESWSSTSCHRISLTQRHRGHLWPFAISGISPKIADPDSCPDATQELLFYIPWIFARPLLRESLIILVWALQVEDASREKIDEAYRGGLITT